MGSISIIMAFYALLSVISIMFLIPYPLEVGFASTLSLGDCVAIG